MWGALRLSLTWVSSCRGARGYAAGMNSGAPSQADTTLHLAFAEASILLMESLLLVLLEKGVLSKKDLLGTVEVALETKRKFIESGIHPEIAKVALGVLQRLENSLAAARAAAAPGESSG